MARQLPEDRWPHALPCELDHAHNLKFAPMIEDTISIYNFQPQMNIKKQEYRERGEYAPPQLCRPQSKPLPLCHFVFTTTITRLLFTKGFFLMLLDSIRPCYTLRSPRTFGGKGSCKSMKWWLKWSLVFLSLQKWWGIIAIIITTKP